MHLNSIYSEEILLLPICFYDCFETRVPLCTHTHTEICNNKDKKLINEMRQKEREEEQKEGKKTSRTETYKIFNISENHLLIPGALLLFHSKCGVHVLK